MDVERAITEAQGTHPLTRVRKKITRTAKHLKEVILQDKHLSKFFTEDELEKLFDFTTYIGNATYQAEEMVKLIRVKREDDSKKYGFGLV